MTWVPSRANLDPAIRPRPLTAEEIDHIIDQLSPPESPDPIAAAVGRVILASYLIFQLDICEMTSGEGALERLVMEIQRRHEIAQVKRGEGLGYHSSDSIGAATSQAALNSFSAVGPSSTIGQGVKGFETLVYTKLLRSDPAMDIHLRLKATFADIIELRTILVMRRVSDFVVRSELGVFLRSDRPRDPDAAARQQLAKDEPLTLEADWWYRIYDLYHPEQPSEYPSHILRLHLNKQAMYEAKVSMAEIAAALASEEGPLSKLAKNAHVTAVASPFEQAIIDVVPNEDFISEARDVIQPAKTFLQNVVRPLLGEIKVKGITGIEKLTPVVVDLLSVFDKSTPLGPVERQVYRGRLQQLKLDPETPIWKLPLSLSKMRLKSINYRTLETFLLKADIRIIGKMANRTQEDCYRVLREAGYGVLPPDQFAEALGGEGQQRLEELANLDLEELRAQLRPQQQPDRFILQSGPRLLRRLIHRSPEQLSQELRMAGYAGVTGAGYPQVLAGGQEPTGYYLILPAASEGANVAAYLRQRMSQDPELKAAAEYVYAVATGSNLWEVISLPFVDDTRTISNNMHEISQVYGVEAGRSYFIYELGAVLAASGVTGLSGRNLTLLTDFIFFKGFPLGIKHTSIVKRGVGFLSSAVNEKWDSVITAAASGQGSRQSDRSVATAVMTGGYARLGRYTYGVDYSQESIDFIRDIIAQEQKLEAYRRNPEAYLQTLAAPPEGQTLIAPYEPQRLEPLAAAASDTKTKLEAAMLETLSFGSVDPALLDTGAPTTAGGWPGGDEELTIPAGPPPSVLPAWWTPAQTRYSPRVAQLWRSLSPQAREALPEFQVDAAPAQPAVTGRTFYFSGAEARAWVQLLQTHQFQQVKDIEVLDHVGVMQVFKRVGKEDERIYTVRSTVKNALTEAVGIINKVELFVRMKATFPELARRHMAASLELSKMPHGFYPPSQPVLIVRPWGRGAYGGRDIYRVQNSEQLERARDKLRPYGRTLVSSYIQDPLLTREGLKFHIRIWMIIMMGQDFVYRWTAFPRGLILTAKEPYRNEDFDNDNIHDTHRATTTGFPLFPEDLPDPSQRDIIWSQMQTIMEAISQLALGFPVPADLRGLPSDVAWSRIQDLINLNAASGQHSINKYTEDANGYKVFGLDFLIREDLTVLVLELNAQLAFDPVESENTGLTHRDRYWADYRQWIYNEAIGPLFDREVVLPLPEPVREEEEELPIDLTELMTSQNLIYPQSNLASLTAALKARDAGD